MSQPEEITLNSLFDEAYKLFESFDKRDDPTNSPEFQVKYSQPIIASILWKYLEKCASLF